MEQLRHAGCFQVGRLFEGRPKLMGSPLESRPTWLSAFGRSITSAFFWSSQQEKSAMLTALQFTNDELTQLHLLVSQDTESSRVELHRTSGVPYREDVKQRVERGDALLKKMNDARPSHAKEVTDSKEF
jgi:hypothetical protein